MNPKQLELLLSKLAGNELSASDRETLMVYLADPANKNSAQEAIGRMMAQNTAGIQLLPEQSSEEIMAAIMAPETPVQPAIIRTMPSRSTNSRWWWAAAAVIITGAASLWYINQPSPEKTIPAPVVADINPASSGAILTLANGSTILLDTLKDGAIATPDGSDLSIRNGHLLAGQTSSATGWNKVSTPNGRQYIMTLADGSKAWLNAGSSLEYPVNFTGNERVVRITGEVYFEVTAQPALPFNVNVKGMEVQVLGTSFNVNAYDDESSINTTLASGSVKIISAGFTPALLKPGQQARFQASAPIKVLPAVDLDKILAWKNGYFSFDDLNLQQVMKLIERWYDVSVKYEGPIPVEQFEGMVSRSMKLSGIIKSLRDMDIEVRQEGRTLIISKK
ncbi:MAG: FecR family protein [Pseudobacter sp.]|uniref:FecR family protein n=1 Tax=Pseudobacter sp. TaxID=2045420 RepID=UPI003F82041E